MANLFADLDLLELQDLSPSPPTPRALEVAEPEPEPYPRCHAQVPWYEVAKGRECHRCKGRCGRCGANTYDGLCGACAYEVAGPKGRR
jgi:hypothetical protein